MIAQIAGGPGPMPDPHSYSVVGWAVVMLVALVHGTRQFIGLWRDVKQPVERHRIVNDPLYIKEAAEFASKKDCIARHTQSVEAAANLQSQLVELRMERKEDVAQMQEKITTVKEDVKGLKTATELQNQQLARMDSKLDRIVERRLGAI